MRRTEKVHTWSGDEEAPAAKAWRIVRDNWQGALAILGFLGIGTVAALAQLLDGLSFINAHVWNKGKLVLWCSCLAIMLGPVVAWCLYENRRIALETSIHRFIHFTRDDVLKMIGGETDNLRHVLGQIVHRTADLLRTIFHATDVQCILWIADKDVYRPIAWTNGVDAKRQESTFLRDGDFVRKLRDEYDLSGIVLIRDTEKVEGDRICGELAAVVAGLGQVLLVPINIREERRRHLAGMLFAYRPSRLHLRRAQLLMACADALGLAYTAVTAQNSRARVAVGSGAPTQVESAVAVLEEAKHG